MADELQDCFSETTENLSGSGICIVLIVVMSMFKRILVPVDFSAKSSRAVDTACGLAAGNQGEIILLHVIETIEHLDFEDLRGFYRKLEESAMAGIRLLADRAAGEDGVTVRTEIVYGKRVRGIIEFAAKRRVDLIVLNSHRVEGNSGFPSISYEVGVLATCPVLLLK